MSGPYAAHGPAELSSLLLLPLFNLSNWKIPEFHLVCPSAPSVSEQANPPMIFFVSLSHPSYSRASRSPKVTRSLTDARYATGLRMYCYRYYTYSNTLHRGERAFYVQIYHLFSLVNCNCMTHTVTPTHSVSLYLTSPFPSSSLLHVFQAVQ